MSDVARKGSSPSLVERDEGCDREVDDMEIMERGVDYGLATKSETTLDDSDDADARVF